MFDYWLWGRERRIHAAAAFWPATLLALPGILIDGRFLPLVYNTIDGFSVLAHGCAAGAGLGVGLAVSLRGFSGGARAEWTGLVLGVTLVPGALVVHWNANVPDAERAMNGSRIPTP